MLVYARNSPRAVYLFVISPFLRLMRLFWLILSTLIPSSIALNVLFYIAAIGKSHLDFTDSLIDTLVERGHTVDLLIGRFNSLVTSNGKSKAARVFSFGFKGVSPWPINDYKFFLNVSHGLCEVAFSKDGPTEFISQRKYDIAIGSDYDFCGFALFRKANIPSTASFTSTAMLPLQAINLGLPSTASSNMFLMFPENLENLVSRTRNLLRWAAANYIHHWAFVNDHTKLARAAYGEDFEDGDHLARDLDVMFINANEILERPRPISHKVQYIGGVNLRPAQPITEEYEKILSLRPRGTVLFCFGTQVPGRAFPRQVKENLVKAFAQFPEYTFIWKYEKQPGDEVLFENSHNLHLVDWLPQNDLLNDKRVVAFISHMGLNSFLEASYAGVPILAIPMFADQPYNAISAKSRGTTVVLDKTKLTTKKIVKALKAVLEDEKYRENARKVRKMLLEKPNQPKDMLNLPGRDLDPIRYYCVDVIFLFFSISALTVFVLYKVTKAVLRVSIRSPAKQKKN
ncbi:unnamed protein product [Caenorhabditis auriculariae]|uniref:glucuronosyltransferase n=1 Tax=Caenorhabditis auriculariae TaxID=2777116 RepID=A0A8S1H8L0_9PELO|nr:unnamed protein product [Caenorhabditis auriculariae]